MILQNITQFMVVIEHMTTMVYTNDSKVKGWSITGSKTILLQILTLIVKSGLKFTNFIKSIVFSKQ